MGCRLNIRRAKEKKAKWDAAKVPYYPSIVDNTICYISGGNFYQGLMNIDNGAKQNWNKDWKKIDDTVADYGTWGQDCMYKMFKGVKVKYFNGTSEKTLGMKFVILKLIDHKNTYAIVEFNKYKECLTDVLYKE